jgi:hypothetical protein
MNKQILKTRLITDSEIIISVVLIRTTEKTATVVTQQGEEVTCKIRTSFDGSRYILPFGKYSFAPSFNL